MGTAQYVSACQRGYRGTHVVIKNSAEEAQLLIQRDNDTWLSSSQDIGQIHNATPGGFIDVALTDWGANSVGFYGVKESL
jgi:hypothetical protein